METPKEKQRNMEHDAKRKVKLEKIEKTKWPLIKLQIKVW